MRSVETSRVAENAPILLCFGVGQSVRDDLCFRVEGHLHALLLGALVLRETAKTHARGQGQGQGQKYIIKSETLVIHP